MKKLLGIIKDKKNWFKVKFKKHLYFFTFLIGWPTITFLFGIADPIISDRFDPILVIIWLSFPFIIFFLWLFNLEKKRGWIWKTTKYIGLGIFLFLVISSSILGYAYLKQYDLKIVEKDNDYIIVKKYFGWLDGTKSQQNYRFESQKQKLITLVKQHCQNVSSYKKSAILFEGYSKKGQYIFDSKGAIFGSEIRFFCASDLEEAMLLLHANLTGEFKTEIVKLHGYSKNAFGKPYNRYIRNSATKRRVQNRLDSLDDIIRNEKRIEANKKQTEATKKQTKQDINPNLITIGSGTGFYINNKGYALTNSHVVEICEQVITTIEGKKILFNVVATDKVNDIGLIKSSKKNYNYLSINKNGAKLGEDVIAVGFPLSSTLSDSVKITKGVVSSLSGMGNNSAQIQIDAALQPGNSGGPIINRNGDVVGIASSGLNKLLMAKDQQYIPENVNFAVASPAIANFLKAKKIKYSSEGFFSSEQSSIELAEIGAEATIKLLCLNTLTVYNTLKSSNAYRDVLLDLN